MRLPESTEGGGAKLVTRLAARRSCKQSQDLTTEARRKSKGSEHQCDATSNGTFEARRNLAATKGD